MTHIQNLPQGTPDRSNLPQTEQHQSTDLIHFQQQQVARAKVIYTYNSLRGYPLSDTEIEDWSATLLRLFPDKTPEMIQEAVDGLIKGEIYYDKHKGIGNIVYALSVLDGSDFLKGL